MRTAKHHPRRWAECTLGIPVYYEEHNTHGGRRFTSLCTKLEYNPKKTYITLHLRSEGNTCQLHRFMMRIKCDNIYVYVLKKTKHFVNTKGLLLLVEDRAKRSTLIRAWCAYRSDSPSMILGLSCVLKTSLPDTEDEQLGWAGMRPTAPAEPEMYRLAMEHGC